MQGQLPFIIRTAFFLGAALALSGHIASAAAVTSATTSANALCTPELTLDKEKLAEFMLRTYPVSTAYLSIGTNPAPLQSHRALLHWLLVKRANGGEDGSDARNVAHIAAAMKDMLDGNSKQLIPSAPIDPVRFFNTPDSNYPVRCVRADATPDIAAAADVPATSVSTAVTKSIPAPVPAPASAAAASAPTPIWLDKIRIRGNPDQLSIDKSNTAGFASVDKAQIDFSSDAVANSRANDVQAYVGYSWIKSSFGNNGSTYAAIPYVGYKQNRVAVYNSDGVVISTTRTSAIGLLSNFHYVHPGSTDTEDFNVRPDYLMDIEDGTRLLSANFTYTAFRKGGLNDLIPTRYGFAVKPILIGESRNGTYLDRGNASVAAAHQDFVRLGGQVGFALVSTNPAIPVDFIATYTGLAAIVGSHGINYRKVGLTYNFNQNVGLALNYSNGTLPETGDREKKWSLGVASKF